LICILLVLFGGEIPKIFIDGKEREVLAMTKQFLIANSLFFIPLVFVNCWRFTIQGMGFSGFAMLAGVSEMIARSLVAFIFIPIFYELHCISSSFYRLRPCRPTMGINIPAPISLVVCKTPIFLRIC